MNNSKNSPSAMNGPVVFFGSGPVASKSLELLHQVASIEAIVTKPKPAHHRGNFPVIDTASRLNLPLFTVSNKEELDELIARRPFMSRLGILIDFGIIVSQAVIDYFPLGIINSHFSLLPLWRGADPITFAILSGQEKTGVSLMLLVKKMDEGPLLAQASIAIDKTTTTPDLTDKLIYVSNDLLKETLLPYTGGQLTPWPQDSSKTPSYSRRLTKEDGIIDWQKPAEQIEREIRAFIGWPGSRTTIANKEILITKAGIAKDTGTPGEYIIRDKQLLIFCKEGALVIERLKPAGKPEMDITSFLAGYKNRL